MAANYLAAGQLVAIPTETVYGLAGNASDPNVVLRIFETKNRPTFDPLIVHTHSVSELAKYVVEIPPMAKALFEEFSPGPLTILLPKKAGIPDLVTSGLPSVAIRIPNHPLTLELLKSLSFPLAAPSANPFGYISPTTAQHVFNQLKGKLPYILDGGSCQVGVESTIIGFENEKPVIHRLGGIPLEAIEKITGPLTVRNSSSNPSTPGQLLSHYAPRKKLIQGNVNELLEKYQNEKVAVISFSCRYEKAAYNYVLSEKADLHDAAKNLFAAMRLADESDATLLAAEIFPNEGLGMAINDRLKRASAR